MVEEGARVAPLQHPLDAARGEHAEGAVVQVGELQGYLLIRGGGGGGLGWMNGIWLARLGWDGVG